MFHVKHNDNDNIIHVHIGTRTRRQAHRRPDAPAAPPEGRPDEPMDARLDKQAIGQASVQARTTYKLATI